MTNTPAFTQAIKNPSVLLLYTSPAAQTIAAGAPTNAVLLATAGTSGSVLKSLNVSTNNSVVTVLYLWVQPGGTGSYYLIGTVNVPVTAGFGTTGLGLISNVDFLADQYVNGLTLDQSGKPVLLLEPSTKLYVGTKTTIASTLACWVSGTQEDF